MEYQDLIFVINKISEMQREESFILTGYYLKKTEISNLKDYLSPDIPNTGAIGRYDNIPIFEIEKLSTQNFRVYQDVVYTYIKMGVVD